MRIAMLSCNTGEGHNSTAKAIREVLDQRGVECEIIDALSCTSQAFSHFICRGQVLLYHFMPKLWDAGYRMTESKEPRFAEVFSAGAKKLYALLAEGKYDAIISVHIFASLMMTEIRQKHGMKVPCYFVATDYTCYPYVGRCDLDGIMMPAQELREEFIQAGISEDKLFPSGIPVRQIFYQRKDRIAARKALGLTDVGTVVLLMGGSMGCGPIRKIAREVTAGLPMDARLVVFCGRNEKLYDSLSGYDDPRLLVLGYTDKVCQYMDAADMIVTKPGGLSTTESANKALPMVLINMVGGCENHNFNFFLSRGYAVGSKDAEEGVALALKLAADAEERGRMADALARDFSRNSAAYIADVVMDSAGQNREKV